MNNQSNVLNERIISKIHLIRNQKVMIDADLAELYDVETKQLKRQVKRHLRRFPKDFMFELTPIELEDLRCQIGTSSWGGTRYMPMVFTEQGVSMLSSILSSTVAIEVNIQIIRTFTKMREILGTQKDLIIKLEELEKRSDSHDESIEVIFGYLKKLVNDTKRSEQKLGYR